jgi:hypothetical protein
MSPTSTIGEHLGPAFAALVAEEGIEEAWSTLEDVRDDPTDARCVAYNMDCHGYWLFAGSMPQQASFFCYPG